MNYDLTDLKKANILDVVNTTYGLTNSNLFAKCREGDEYTEENAS